MAENSVTGTAARTLTNRQQQLSAGAAAKRERVARAQRDLDVVTARWRKAGVRVVQLQAAGAPARRVMAAKEQRNELAAACLAARAALAAARAPRRARR